MIRFLFRNKGIAVLVLIAYFLFLVSFHSGATDIADWLKYKMTLEYYNIFLLCTGLAISISLGIVLWLKIRKEAGYRIIFLGFIITLMAIFLSMFTMMVVNMEAIHFIQYGILAALIFPLVRRFSDALTGAFLLGLLDELYQYIYINPDFKYYDFNDLILNMLGAGAGLIVVAMASSVKPFKPRKWYRSSSFGLIFTMILLGIVFSIGLPATFFPVPPDEQVWHWFSIYRENLPDQFWTPLYEGRKYHIFSPWEGIATLSLLTVFYSGIDYFYPRVLPHDTAGLI